VGNAARKGERRGVYRVLVGKPEGQNLEDLSIDLRIIFKRIFKKRDWGAQTE
jgi:hypothetical protein